MGQFITISIVVFLITILVLVILLLVSKKYLSPSGKVKLTINGDKEMTVDQGSSVLSTLNENGVFLPSACGGKGSCGQCKLQVVAKLKSIAITFTLKICLSIRKAFK